MSRARPRHPFAWRVTEKLVEMMELERDAEDIVDDNSRVDEDQEGWLQTLLDVRKSIQVKRVALRQLGWCYPETIEQAKIMCSAFGRDAESLSDAEQNRAVALINALGRRQGLLEKPQEIF